MAKIVLNEQQQIDLALLTLKKQFHEDMNLNPDQGARLVYTGNYDISHEARDNIAKGLKAMGLKPIEGPEAGNHSDTAVGIVGGKTEVIISAEDYKKFIPESDKFDQKFEAFKQQNNRREMTARDIVEPKPAPADLVKAMQEAAARMAVGAAGR